MVMMMIWMVVVLTATSLPVGPEAIVALSASTTLSTTLSASTAALSTSAALSASTTTPPTTFIHWIDVEIVGAIRQPTRHESRGSEPGPDVQISQAIECLVLPFLGFAKPIASELGSGGRRRGQAETEAERGGGHRDVKCVVHGMSS
jgi:hypothetical protein